jgi:hypothetical protein
MVPLYLPIGRRAARRRTAERLESSGIFAEGESIEARSGLTSLARSNDFYVFIGTGEMLAALFGRHYMQLPTVAVCMTTGLAFAERRARKVPGGKPTDGIAGSFPKRGALFVATDQRLIAIASPRVDGERGLVVATSLPWDAIDGATDNRTTWLTRMVSFSFIDGTVLTLSAPRFDFNFGFVDVINTRARVGQPDWQR